MKIIITGATGFVGRNIAENFHDNNLHVVATGRSLKIGDELKNKGIRFKKADILDLNQLTDAFTPADCVIHCAGKHGDWGEYKDFFEVNVAGTRNVIEACWRCKIKKIIFISTPSIYYTGKDRYDISESDPLPDRQLPYGKTKLTAEKELLSLCAEGFKIIIFRPRALYGPYDNTIVPRILQLSEKKRFPLINNGKASVDITYIDNFVDAVKTSLYAEDNVWNEVYNISNGNPISVRDWFSQVLEIFERPFIPKNIPVPVAKFIAGIMEFASHLPYGDRKPSMTRFSVGYMGKSMTMAIDKAEQKLCYSPNVSNQQGFERYAKWYKSN